MNEITTGPGLPANTNNLVKYLEKAFTNKETFLTEAMQNARRAGATYVKFNLGDDALIIEDDGVGITDKSLLFTIAESGWGNDPRTEAVVQQEDPFGVGFLSLLFAARWISVVSTNFCIEGLTDDILHRNDFHKSLFSSVIVGTRITLIGLKCDTSKFQEVLEKAAMGFPISVWFNGKVIDNPNALVHGRFIDSPLGKIRLTTGLPRYPTLAAYLQGLPVQVNSFNTYGCGSAVVHLTSKKYSARVPDRDKLNDCDAFNREWDSWYAGYVLSHFKRLKASSSPLDFVSEYSRLKSWGFLDLLDDVPLVPKEVLRIVNGMPYMSTEDYGDLECLENYHSYITKEEIESGSVRVISLKDVTEMQDWDSAAFLTWMAAQEEAGSDGVLYFVFSGQLGSGHWLWEYIIDQNDCIDCSVRVTGETSRAWYDGVSMSRKMVVFCDSYVIQPDPLNEGDPEWSPSPKIMDRPVHCNDTIFVPNGTFNGNWYDLILQCDRYYDSNSDQPFSRELMDREVASFSQFIRLNRSQSPAEILRVLLVNCQLGQYPRLVGQSFSVEVGKEGFITVELTENKDG
jgi:hypothetical protein